MKRLSIKEWDEQDRPREKLVSRGASALSDAELVAVLLGTGTTGYSAVEVAQNLLDAVGGSLVELGRKGPAELQGFHGVGLAKGVGIAAALELGRRRKAEELPKPQYIGGSADVVTLLQPLLADLTHEEVWALLLTKSKRIIEKFRVSQGSVDGSVIDPRIIIRRALERGATGIVVAHNHPSGRPSPDELDLQNTRKLKTAAAYFDMRLLDHIILTDSPDLSFSFAENGLL